MIESEEENFSLRLSIPLKLLHKEILVIDGEDFSELIFSYNIMSIDMKTNINSNNKFEK